MYRCTNNNNNKNKTKQKTILIPTDLVMNTCSLAMCCRRVMLVTTKVSLSIPRCSRSGRVPFKKKCC